MSIVKCRIADFNVSFENDIQHYSKIMRNFLADYDVPDIFVTVTEDDIQYEKDNLTDKSIKIYPSTFKLSASFRKFAEALPAHNSFVLHSATFDINGVAVAFAAHSGTGKTTHMQLWQQLLGEKMVVVNGDKPIVRFFENEPNKTYVYGTPWNGKEALGCNMRSELKHICFIERSETNYVQRIDKSDAINRIMKQIYMPKDNVARMTTIPLINKLISNCNFWTIHCNMNPEAAKVAYKAIFNDSKEI